MLASTPSNEIRGPQRAGKPRFELVCQFRMSLLDVRGTLVGEFDVALKI
jgi:hypothetical protein